MLYLNLLGTPEIYLDSQIQLRFRTRKAQALLIYLAVTQRRWTRDALATLFWPETDDATARKNLRDILPPFRRQLDDYLKVDDDTIGLDGAKPYVCDVNTFSEVLERPLQAIESPRLADTLALYRGEFLEGYTSARISADFELWAMRERERLHQLALMGFTTLCRRQQEAGAYEAAITTNRQFLKLVPWDEAAHRQQMLLLAQSGQRAAALAHFDACCQILADELDAEPDEETVQLYEQIKAGRAFAQPPAATSPQPPAAPATPATPHNLPRQLTSLVGRANDIAAVIRLLNQESTALITLIGQGGVGKTRLALAVAQQMRQHNPGFFPDGIWFVSLAGITAGEQATEQIAGAIAQAMILSLSGSEPLTQQLLRALQAQRGLLVLDNFEHLVAEQPFLLEIVQTAHQVKLLVTSREQLRLHAEHLYPVIGLPVPAADEVAVDEKPVWGTVPVPVQARSPRSSPPMDLGQYPGVQLFVTRVQQRLPEFQLTPQNQPNIGRVCRLLGGVPLGIELAAQLYVEQGGALLTRLIAEIEQLDPLERPLRGAAQGLDHLQTPAIDLPPRQRSIHAVFLHSWQLLTAAEQALLRHCAIFRGGFSREAILTVSNGDGAALLALVTKSLVRRDSHDRYDLHELVRQYVVEELQQEPSALHAAAQNHATYFVELTAGQEETLLQQPQVYQLLHLEIYNLRATWHWLTNPQGMTQRQLLLLDRYVPCFFHFLSLRSQLQEALVLARQAVAVLRDHLQMTPDRSLCTQLLGRLLAHAAEAGVRTEERLTVKAWVNEARGIGETFADATLLSQVYLILGLLNASGSNLEVELFDRALIWAKEAASPLLQTKILLTAIPSWVTTGTTRAKATANCEGLAEIIKQRGYRLLIGDMLFCQGLVYRSHEQYERAIQTLEQAIEACQNGQSSAVALRMAHEALGQICLQNRQWTKAQQWAHSAYQQSKIQGNQLSMLNNLYTMGTSQIRLQQWRTAEGYMQEIVITAEALEATHFMVLGYMGLGMLHNHQQLYQEGLFYYQKAAELATQANYPANWAVSLSGIANAYLFQERIDEAYATIAPLLVDDKLFSFNNRTIINLAAVTYRILTARQDPRAEQILERVHSILQTELATFTDPTLRATFIENDSIVQNVMQWWEEKHGAAQQVVNSYS